MKKFKEFSGYKKAFAGFLNKGKKQEDQQPDFDESRLLPDEDGYFPAFAGFLNKNTKKKKKKLHEDILKTFNKTLTKLKPGKSEEVYKDGLHAKLVKHYKNLENEYGVKHAIENYTGEGYRTLNSKLFKNKRLTPYEKSYESYLSKGLKIHKTPADMVIHTGIKKDLQDMAPASGGVHKLKFPAYTSTSIHREKADGFARNRDSDHVFEHDESQKVPPKILLLHKQLKKIGHSNQEPENWDKHNDNIDKHREKFKQLNDLVKKHTGKILDHNNYSGALRKRYDTWGPSSKKPPNADYNPEHNLKYHDTTEIHSVPKAGHVISIHVPKGSHGAYVDHVSMNEGEREFVLHKGAKVHIHPKPEFDKGENKYRWKGVLVHDGVKPTGLK